MHDRRKAPWLPGGCRVRGFEVLVGLAREGLNRPQMAARLGTTKNALSCYFRRQGITMPELREAADGA